MAIKLSIYLSYKSFCYIVFDKNCLRNISASFFLKTVRIIKKPIKTDKYESIKYYYLLEFQLLLL